MCFSYFTITIGLIHVHPTYSIYIPNNRILAGRFIISPDLILHSEEEKTRCMTAFRANPNMATEMCTETWWERCIPIADILS